ASPAARPPGGRGGHPAGPPDTTHRICASPTPQGPRQAGPAAQARTPLPDPQSYPLGQPRGQRQSGAEGFRTQNAVLSTEYEGPDEGRKSPETNGPSRYLPYRVLRTPY